MASNIEINYDKNTHTNNNKNTYNNNNNIIMIVKILKTALNNK